MLGRFFRILALALMFALGQQGAAMHAVTHLAKYQQQDDKPHAESVCDQCLGYAQLSSALGSSNYAPALAVPSTPEYLEFGRSAESSPLRTYAARAPPFPA